MLRISSTLIFPFSLLLVIVILIPSSTQKEPLGLDEWFVKLYIEFVTILFPFYVWVFWLQGMWDHIKPAPPTLEGEVLTTHWTTREVPQNSFCSFMCNVNFSPPFINFIFLKFVHSVTFLVNIIYWFWEYTKMEKQTGYPLFLPKKNFFLLFSTLFFMSISSIQSLSHVQLFATPWTAAYQASLSITNSRSLLELMSVKSVMPSNHLVLCHPLLLLPSMFLRIWVFSNESVLPSGGQTIGVSASAPVLPMNIQDWFPLGLTDLISLRSKALSRVFANTTVQKHQFFSTLLSL